MFRPTRWILLVVVLCGGCQGAETVAQDPLDSTTLELLKTFTEEFVAIMPGADTFSASFPASFSLGAKGGNAEEQPPVEVTLKAPFAIAKYEVPQNLYEAVMGKNPSRWQGPRNSAETMSWHDANEFCERVTVMLRQAKLMTEQEVIRLPSEVEWEYCCRAGTDTQYSFGDAAQADGDVEAKATLLDAYAWHTGNAAGNDPAVGVLKPNPWGLYDMHGYLAEYCSDDWIGNYEVPPAGSAPRAKAGSGMCVIRGGSWKDRFTDLRSSSRKASLKRGQDDAVGFRCVKAVPSGL